MFKDNILGFVHEAEWLDVGTTVTRPNDPIDGLFGDERTENIYAKWQTINDLYRVPVAAQYHAFDVETKTTVRKPVDTHVIEKGLIKVKINQSERMQQLLRTGIHRNELLEYVLNDGIILADMVNSRTKVAKNELLATGQITIKENNLNLTVDYGVPSDNKSHTLNITTTSDVPSQIQAIVDAAKNNGTVLTGLYCQSSVISAMKRNKKLQEIINGTAKSGALLRNAELKDYFSSEFGITNIITNDLVYNPDDGIGSDGRPVVSNIKKYYPADKISFFATNPAGKIGVGLWGNPPSFDERKKRSTGVSQYIYIDQWREKDPDVLWTRASGLFVPVLFNPSSLYIATVSTS